MSWDGTIYDKYRIEHADGTPLKGKKYFVLRLDSDNPVEAARVAAAMRAYKGEPRNCDVGTAEEQQKRFVTFCNSHWNIHKFDDNCKGCPVEDRSGACEFAWAQIPYEAGAEKGGIE